MKTKKFTARTMSEGLKIIATEFGDEAIILSNSKTAQGVEIFAAVEESGEHVQTEGFVRPSSDIIKARPQPEMESMDKQQVQNLLQGLKDRKPDPFNGASSSNGDAKTANELDEWLHQSIQPQKETSVSTPKAKQVAQNRQVPTQRPNKPSTQGTSVAQGKPNKTPKPSQPNPKKVTRLAEHRMEQQKHLQKTAADIQQMRREIHDLKHLLEQQGEQLTALAEPFDPEPDSGPDPKLLWLQQQLQSLALTETTSQELLDRLPGIESTEIDLPSVEEAWRLLMAHLAAQLQTFQVEPIEKGGCYSFIGMTGSGKTTTIGKLATRFAMEQNPKDLLLISLDHFRIGSQDALRVMSKILKCDFEILNETHSLEALLEKHHQKKLILIDTCGSPQGLELYQHQVVGGQWTRKIHPLAVLPCTAQAAILADHLRLCREFSLAGAVVTKTDESCAHGAALSLCLENHLPIAYWTDGQNIPEDLHFARANQLVRNAVAALKGRETQEIVSNTSEAKAHFQTVTATGR